MIDLGIQLSVAVFLALFFAGSGFHKLANRADFTLALEGYDVVSGLPLKLVSFILPVIELATAAIVLVPEFRLIGGQLSISLFTLYGLMIIMALIRGQAGIDCGCSWGNSNNTTPITISLVYRNIVLVLIAAVTLLQPEVREIMWLDWVSAVMAALSAMLIYQAFEVYISVSEFQKEQN